MVKVGIIPRCGCAIGGRAERLYRDDSPVEQEHWSAFLVDMRGIN